LLKGLQSLELNRLPYPTPENAVWDGELASLGVARAERIWAIWEALRAGHSIQEVAEASLVDTWFIAQIAEIVALENTIREYGNLDNLPQKILKEAKTSGFGDGHLAWLLGQYECEVRLKKKLDDITPSYH